MEREVGDAINGGVTDEAEDGEVAWILIVGFTICIGSIEFVLVACGGTISKTAH